MPCIKQIDEMLCIEHEINSIIKRNKITSNRWNERCADLIRGQHLLFCDLNHSTNFVTPQKGCSIAEGFLLLHFPLVESYVWLFTHMYIVCIMNLS